VVLVDRNASGIPSANSIKKVVEAARCCYLQVIVGVEPHGNGRRRFWPGRHTIRRGPQRLDRESEAPLVPGVHCSLILCLPRHRWEPPAKGNLNVRVTLTTKVGGVEEGQVDVLHVGSVEASMELVPDQISKDARTYPPVRWITVPGRVKNLHEPGRSTY